MWLTGRRLQEGGRGREACCNEENEGSTAKGWGLGTWERSLPMGRPAEEPCSRAIQTTAMI